MSKTAERAECTLVDNLNVNYGLFVLDINLTVQGQSDCFLPLAAAGVCAHPLPTGSPFPKSGAPQQAARDPEEECWFISLHMWCF